jgi:thiamine-monophosphate kinase
LNLGPWLASHGLASAALDTSDSLAQCALHLARASGVGLHIDLQGYSFDPHLRALAAAGRKYLARSKTRRKAPDTAFALPSSWSLAGKRELFNSLAQYLLASAEDYQLLFTAPPASREALADAPVPLTRIGRVADITAGYHYIDEAGVKHELTELGWQHR